MAERVADDLGYCCLGRMLFDTMSEGSRGVAAKLGFSRGHISWLRRQFRAGDIDCVKSRKCMKPMPLTKAGRKAPESPAKA